MCLQISRLQSIAGNYTINYYIFKLKMNTKLSKVLFSTTKTGFERSLHVQKKAKFDMKHFILRGSVLRVYRESL